MFVGEDQYQMVTQASSPLSFLGVLKFCPMMQAAHHEVLHGGCSKTAGELGLSAII